MSKSRRIDDPKWLRSVRDDLESKADAWARSPDPGGVSKAEAIGRYLDAILTELGCPPPPHRCPECGNEHSR